MQQNLFLLLFQLKLVELWLKLFFCFTKSLIMDETSNFLMQKHQYTTLIYVLTRFVATKLFPFSVVAHLGSTKFQLFFPRVSKNVACNKNQHDSTTFQTLSVNDFCCRTTNSLRKIRRVWVNHILSKVIFFVHTHISIVVFQKLIIPFVVKTFLDI